MNKLLNKYGNTLVYLYNSINNITTISRISTDTTQSYNSVFNSLETLKTLGYIDYTIEGEKVLYSFLPKINSLKEGLL